MGNPHSNHIIPPHIDFQNHLVKSERDAELSADTIPFDYVHRHRLQHFQCVNDANRCEELVEQISRNEREENTSRNKKEATSGDVKNVGKNDHYKQPLEYTTCGIVCVEMLQDLLEKQKSIVTVEMSDETSLHHSLVEDIAIMTHVLKFETGRVSIYVSSYLKNIFHSTLFVYFD